MLDFINYLPKKSFNTYGIVFLTLFGLIGVLVIGISSSFTFNNSFHCYDKTISKTKETSLIENINIKCSLKYQEKFRTQLIFVMIIVNFVIVFTLSIIYGFLVKHRVEKFELPTRVTNPNNVDDENQVMLSTSNPWPNPADVRQCLESFSTFSIYIIHLMIARIIPLLVFALWIFYPAHIPNNFSCPWKSEMKAAETSNFNDTINSRYNLTFIDCTNPFGERSQTLAHAVATIDVFVATLAFVELGYILWCVCSDRSFMTDQEFCTVYLLRKRKRIRKFVNKVREGFNLLDELDDFGGTDISTRPIKEIYVNVVIQVGEEQSSAYPKKYDRHEIYRCHLETPRNVTKLTELSDIFKPIKGQSNQTYPRTILVIGRPGIGKTMLTKKLLHQWKEKGDEFWHDKMVILLRLRKFNKRKVSFRDMIFENEGIKAGEVINVYNFVLLNPQKTVLIFDGLDELSVDSNLLNTDCVCTSGPNQQVPAFLILKMLVNKEMLRDINVVVTSRSTAKHVFRLLPFNRKVEILGFFKEEIESYVYNFCENDDATAKEIWDHIKGSGELLSLCYVPVNSYIVCLTLKETMKTLKGRDLEGPIETHFFPKTVTELYKRAVKVLIYRHHPKYKTREPPSDYLIECFPEELERSEIKQVAKYGIEKGELIFNEASKSKFQELANCGFFHKFPDKERNYFCFLHLTLQEFFAALSVVDDMDNIDQFLEEGVKDPKWHLVIQFVAGLIGDKLKETEKACLDRKDKIKSTESETVPLQKIADAAMKRLVPYRCTAILCSSVVRISIK